MKKYASVFLMILILLCAAESHSTRNSTMIHEDVRLEPDESFIATIAAEKPIHVGWKTKQKPWCETNCVKAVQLGSNTWEIAAQHGASNQYDPEDNQIQIQYTNQADHFVIIDIYTEEQICDSEACQLIKEAGITYPFDFNQINSDWKRVTLENIASMETSADGSYSKVRGTTVFGTEFDVTILWWLIDEQSVPNCREWIPKYGKRDPTKDWAYQFSGSFITNPPVNIFTDTGCSKYTFKEKDASDL